MSRSSKEVLKVVGKDLKVEVLGKLEDVAFGSYTGRFSESYWGVYACGKCRFSAVRRKIMLGWAGARSATGPA